MFGHEDNTFQELRDRSFQSWLEEMASHDDVAVRGGVRLAQEYVDSLKQEILLLKHKNQLKDEYLKKIVNKYKYHAE